ncbi:hypothetical protein MCOR27_003928 [Pyricularia oryzae]|uniref:Uncharacterized protein n=2 Tax=Pyricularia TaxID=48558 RepID=A0ABQ8NF92_PYRGI|nr:hypothetical protein MCOR01_005959 [Pyricularia oryzae]KAI6295677.1 hypothetical protein MCOR33_007472 [Pyricularia grisea]KAI6258774.1 hypothetical protein MCOR19_004873 [Pyricularia oryzae]KAI6282005.1 hypothetical protein MCOR27_003928 [Pyricularia oryzae]KAI6283536.1 hypothetical protein MCOR26_002357 [Pyricularia oryzae]
MSSSENSHGYGRQPAYCEDADQNDNSIEGTKVAASVAPGSPGREISNTRRARSNRSMPEPLLSPSSDDSSVASSSGSGSGSSSADRRAHRKPDVSRRKSTRDHPKSPTSKRVTYAEGSSRYYSAAPEGHGSRSRRSIHQEDAAWYGRSSVDADPLIMPGVSRPRAGTGDPSYRHSSYHVNTTSRPPLANARYATHHPIPPHQMPPGPPPMAGSFPPPLYPPPQGPPQPWGMPHLVQHMHPPQPPPPPSMGGYFPPQEPIRSLESRFESMSMGHSRSASAMGHRPVRYDDGLYDQENRAPAVSIQRRSSAKAKKREEQARLEDRMRMPPPPRPHSTAPRQISTGPFVPPRGPGDNPFTPRTPTSAELEPFNYAQERARMRRPSVSSRRPMSYDHGAYQTEVATTRPDRNRRNSYYGGGAPLENKTADKMAAAQAYQDAVEGGPPAALTAEALRKAERRSRPAPSSRSTRSSASREESDFVQKSATTRTTRYSDEGDDFTVRVVGAATLKMGGAELQCKEGAEINFSRGNSAAIGEGSDRSSYIDPADDRRVSRPARPTTSHRPRTSSHVGSYSRAGGYENYLEYDTQPASYQHRMPPLPPPADNSGNPYAHYNYRDNYI